MTAGLSRAALQTLKGTLDDLHSWLRVLSAKLERNPRTADLYMQEICGLRSWCQQLADVDALLTAPSSPEPLEGDERRALLRNVLEKGHDVEQLRAQVVALADRFHALTGYVQHKDECEVNIVTRWKGEDGYQKCAMGMKLCACGLASLLTSAPPDWPALRDNGKPNRWHEFQEDPETTICIICGWAEQVHTPAPPGEPEKLT